MRRPNRLNKGEHFTGETAAKVYVDIYKCVDGHGVAAVVGIETADHESTGHDI